PERIAAAVRYSGRWSESAYRRHLADLEAGIARAGLVAAGPPRFARFDPPFTPWFLRRNEVCRTWSGPRAAESNRAGSVRQMFVFRGVRNGAVIRTALEAAASEAGMLHHRDDHRLEHRHHGRCARERTPCDGRDSGAE